MDSKDEKLTIEIPKLNSVNNDMPQTLSYQWCKALHKALQPLDRLRVFDGSSAFHICVAANPHHQIHLSRKFLAENMCEFIDKDKKINFVCRIIFGSSNSHYAEVIHLYFDDFKGDAKKVKLAFQKMAQHIKDHVLEQSPPEWLDNVVKQMTS